MGRPTKHAWVGGLLLLATVVRADPTLVSAPSRYAPLEVSKGQDPSIPLTKSQRRDIVKQFEGLLYMAVHGNSYEKWPGRSMSDCSPGRSGPWRYQCDITMPNAHGVYFFYPHRLQRMEVQFGVSDSSLLVDLKRRLDSIFGQGKKLGHSTWRWKNGAQSATLLMMDPSEIPGSGFPLLRFQWERSRTDS